MPSDNVYLREILSSVAGVSVGQVPEDTSNVYLRQIASYMAAASGGGGSGSVSWAALTGKPTTVSGFGITDAVSTSASQSANTVLAAPSGAAGSPAFRALSLVDLPIQAQNDLWTKIVFTPTTTDWYRVIDETSVGGELAGLIRISGINAAGNKWSCMASFQGEGSAGSFGVLTQIYSTNVHVATAVRTTTTATTRTAVDILVGTANIAMTVEFIAWPLANPITVPVVGSGLGSDFQLFFGPAGIRTTAGLTQGNVANGLVKSSSGDLVQAVSGTDYTMAVTAPTASNSSGTTGNIAVATGFLYVCIAANTWQRAVLTSF